MKEKFPRFERTLDSSELNRAEVWVKLHPKTVAFVSQQSFICWKDPQCKSLHPWTPALNQQQQLVRGFVWSHSNHLPPQNLQQHTLSTNPWQNIVFHCIICRFRYKICRNCSFRRAVDSPNWISLNYKPPTFVSFFLKKMTKNKNNQER